MIRFFEEGKYKLAHKKQIKRWLHGVVANEGKLLQDMNIVFCTDEELLEKNIKYLKHNTLTDIITFDYSHEDTTSGEIFISIDRIKDNALTLDVDFFEELCRVMVHGVLHLVGYKDKSKSEQLEMRKKEDYYLSLRNF